MGDRLTLETAALLAHLRDWLAHYPEDVFAPPPKFTDPRERLLSTVVAAQMGRHVLRRLIADVEDVHPRLFGERLPASADPPQNTGGCYGTHLVLPPGWELDATPAGEWRATDPGEAVDLTGPDAEELARSAWKHWARAERGPTEGASDADIDARKVLLALADEMESECDSFDEWGARVRGCALSMPERPPTGEASPEPRATPAAYVASAVHNEKRAKAVEAKLGTLIGAVEDALDIEHETPVVTIRAALDAAKGDAPAATPSRTADEVDDAVAISHQREDQRRVCRDLDDLICAKTGEDRGPPEPAPQVPDSPGWAADDMHILRGVAIGYPFQSDDDRSVPDHLNSIADRIEASLGGRCTRDAPDVAMPDKLSTMSGHTVDGPFDTLPMGLLNAKWENTEPPSLRLANGRLYVHDAPDDGLRARVEAAWAAFENDDGFDGSLRGAQLADRLRKALDGS